MVAESVELLTEEGEVIVQQVQPDSEPTTAATAFANAGGAASEFLGPVALWIGKGMPTAELLTQVGLADMNITATDGSMVASSHAVTAPDIDPAPREAMDDRRGEAASVTQISIHTIGLPERAPKQLLLELKTIFATFPGREKVQLKIGERMVPVPMTITMSPILEKHIDEAIKKFAVSVAYRHVFLLVPLVPLILL